MEPVVLVCCGCFLEVGAFALGSTWARAPTPAAKTHKLSLHGAPGTACHVPGPYIFSQNLHAFFTKITLSPNEAL